MVDDNLAYVAWGYDPGQASQPVLIVHGGQDRIAPSSPAEWLARYVPSSELWLRPDGGTSPSSARAWRRWSGSGQSVLERLQHMFCEQVELREIGGHRVQEQVLHARVDPLLDATLNLVDRTGQINGLDVFPR